MNEEEEIEKVNEFLAELRAIAAELKALRTLLGENYSLEACERSDEAFRKAYYDDE